VNKVTLLEKPTIKRLVLLNAGHPQNSWGCHFVLLYVVEAIVAQEDTWKQMKVPFSMY
jgi:hypothetical protein